MHSQDFPEIWQAYGSPQVNKRDKYFEKSAFEPRMGYVCISLGSKAFMACSSNRLSILCFIVTPLLIN